MQTPSEQSYREIPLTQGYSSIVDAEDFERLIYYNWFAKWNARAKSFYACRNVPFKIGKRRQRIVWMHREILGLSPDDPREGDHAQHNTLDNRKFIDGKENLRISTRQENNCNQRLRKDNSTGYKGVCRQGNNYRVRIRVDRKEIALGSRSDIIEAAKLYDAAALKYFGKFAHLNFPLVGI